MEQTKALNALEPFLALTKSASSPRAAADLIDRATSNPNTFLFSELLYTPQIQALSQSPEFAPHLTLLQIFSYGTYDDYKQKREPSLPELNDAQTLKLRQLTLLTIAKDRDNLSYAKLRSALALEDNRALEALVTSAVYGGLLTATLDPVRQHIHVKGLAPLRDLRPDAVPNLIASLRTWSDRCISTLDGIEAQATHIRDSATYRHRDAITREAKLNQLVEDARVLLNTQEGGGPTNDRSRKPARGGSYSLRGGRGKPINKRGSNLMDAQDTADDEAMDLDQDEEDQKRASRRKL